VEVAAEIFSAGGDLPVLAAPVMTSSVDCYAVLRPSSDDLGESTMKVELLCLLVVSPWLWRTDPNPPGVLGLGGVAGLVPRLWVPSCDEYRGDATVVSLGSGVLVSRPHGILAALGTGW
jgi:hypothetical protein